MKKLVLTPALKPESMVSIICRVESLADSGQTLEALQLAENSPYARDPFFQNAKGVCLMRMERHDLAITTLQNLVCHPQSSKLKRDLPIFFYTNFSLSLLLGGLPRECCERLSEVREWYHPSVARCHGALSQWTRSLDWMEWIDWAMGGEPTRRVNLGQAPGDFFDPVIRPHVEAQLQVAHPTMQVA